MKKLLFILIVTLLGFASAQDIFELNQRLGRGVNFGNALEAPSEGAWGMTLETSYFDLVKQGGFDTIRLPVSWTYHAAKNAPYTINSEFMKRVTWAVDEASSRGLNIVVNIHHYDELNQNPVAEEARYLAIWKQIAEHFKDYPDSVYFELLNEPHGEFNTDANLWNQLLAKSITTIRLNNPTRAVIVGPVNWNSIGSLGKLELPDDPYLITTVHFYDPFAFTHQGAEWVNPSPPVGKIWTGGNPSFSPTWQNQSWDTEISFVKDGINDYLEIKYSEGWAGFSLHNIKATKGYTTLVFTTKEAIDLRISCNTEKDDEAAFITSNADTETLLELSACGNPEKVKDLILQNASETAQTVLLEMLELRGPKGVLSPFVDEKTQLQDPLDVAATWATKHNRPIFLGEFGSYDKADLDSRIRWTTFVRSEIEKRGFSWAYWEFGAGFGVYDRTANVWREELLNALIQR
jgi:endoglucanase